MSGGLDRGKAPIRPRSRPRDLGYAVAAILLMLATALAVGGCGDGQDGTTASAGSKVQLVYQDWRTEWFPPMAQEELAKFHDQHPEISVFYTPDPEDLAERMPLEMQAGNAPDVFQGCCGFFPAWAQEGYILDLRTYVDEDLDRSIVSDWDTAQYRSFFDSEGHLFGVPKYQGTLVLYYNKDLFDEYEVAYPTAEWTHEDYLVAMQGLTHDTDGDGRTDIWGSMIDIGWDRLQVHMNAWGGHIVDPDDPTQCDLDAPESLAALEWVRARMWDDHVMASFTDINNLETRVAFAEGKLAMVEDGSWALKSILEQADFRIGVAPIPSGPAGRATLSTTDGFGIYAGTRHPDEAWELVKFLVGRDYALAMARANLLQPARLSLMPEWQQLVREQYPGKTTEMDLDVFAQPHREGYSVVQEVFPNDMATASALVDEAFTQIFTLGHTSIDSLTDVSAQIEDAQSAVAR